MDKEIEYGKYLDMEYIVQSDDTWTEAPLMGVKLALEILKYLHLFNSEKSELGWKEEVYKQAIEYLSRFGNLEEMRRLGLREEYIKTLYQMNYGGDRGDEEESEWASWYREDLREDVDEAGLSASS